MCIVYVHVHADVYTCVEVCLHMCVWMERLEVNIRHLPQSAFTAFFSMQAFPSSLGLTIRLGWLTNELHRFTCLNLPVLALQISAIFQGFTCMLATLTQVLTCAWHTLYKSGNLSAQSLLRMNPFLI